MSDYNSSLPIRTENNGDVVAKIGDATTPSQQLAINASGEASVTATNLDVRDLAFATDKVDVTGSEVSLDSATLAALENITVSANNLDIRDLTAASDSVAAHLKDANGTAFSTSNPLPVSLTADIAGDEINNYQTNAAIAANATSNHDYTVTTGKTLLLGKVIAAASGKAKIEIQIETGVASGTFVTRAVQFNSTANPNMEVQFSSPPSVAAGVRVRVIRTNKDNQAQDLYSTIMGQEV